MQDRPCVLTPAPGGGEARRPQDHTAPAPAHRGGRRPAPGGSDVPSHRRGPARRVRRARRRALRRRVRRIGDGPHDAGRPRDGRRVPGRSAARDAARGDHGRHARPLVDPEAPVDHELAHRSDLGAGAPVRLPGRRRRLPTVPVDRVPAVLLEGLGRPRHRRLRGHRPRAAPRLHRHDRPHRVRELVRRLLYVGRDPLQRPRDALRRVERAEQQEVRVPHGDALRDVQAAHDRRRGPLRPDVPRLLLGDQGGQPERLRVLRRPGHPGLHVREHGHRLHVHVRGRPGDPPPTSSTPTRSPAGPRTAGASGTSRTGSRARAASRPTATSRRSRPAAASRSPSPGSATGGPAPRSGSRAIPTTSRAARPSTGPTGSRRRTTRRSPPAPRSSATTTCSTRTRPPTGTRGSSAGPGSTPRRSAGCGRSPACRTPRPR